MSTDSGFPAQDRVVEREPGDLGEWIHGVRGLLRVAWERDRPRTLLLPGGKGSCGVQFSFMGRFAQKPSVVG